jgi:uncharacterized membrane protein YeaQ/YmgE (transglycosylase-associated protein family)
MSITHLGQSAPGFIRKRFTRFGTTPRASALIFAKPILVLLLGVLVGLTAPLMAQTGGQGALEGSVLDPGGAAVAHATVTAINQASGVASTRSSSSAGVYEITPLIPGIYTITVTADGFETLKQENIEVNGMAITGYNATLKLGAANETVTVTDAPPQLETTNATLGDVITNETYSSLPVLMNNLQRDPTAFATLAPGAQSGTRAPIMSGTGDYLAEVYLDGVPTTVSNMQGDNRPVSLSVPVESVDQMQVVTSGPSAEYQGAGAISLTTKSGGNNYHGEIVDFIRNTAFDTWGFSAPALTQPKVVNGVSTNVPAGKPVEHQNELSVAVGGPIPFTRHKGFFFTNYDKYHGRQGVSPSLLTIPTTLMQQGNFTELGSTPLIYNPLTNVCATSSSCSRSVFAYGGVNNVINPSYISPISQYEQKFMPTPSLSGIANNYLAGGISGYDNHELTFKIDYDLTNRQRYSFVYAHGVRRSVGYGASLPLPYTNANSSVIAPTTMIIEHQYIVSSQMVNQFKYAFTRFAGPVSVPTEGVAGYRASDTGITGLPAGQASDDFPYTTFGTTTAFPNAQSTWAGDYAYSTTPNSFTIVDNLQWSKGKHAFTFGIETQWLEDNSVAFTGPTRYFDQQFAGVSTANFAGTSLSSTATGYSYASYMLGAVNNSGINIAYNQDYGGRYHPVSPYVQDDWKVTPNLTVSLGLRWDYLPPYHEVEDRWSFFNPNGMNAATGTAGELEFAGNRGAAISCNCRTPVHTYWKNFGPRLGLSWSVNDKTVVRAGYAIAYTRGGGVGGRTDDATGVSELGFGSSMILPTAVSKGVTSGPSYYLNNSTGFAALGDANTNFGGVGYSIPAQTGPSAAALTTNIGNYVNSAGAYVTPSSAPGYADPYLSGRAPELEFFNLGIQRVLTKDLTIMVNYSGSESHFVAGTTQLQTGFWSGQIDPAHIAATGSTLATDNATNILSAQATAANIALAQAADSGISVPSWYAAAGAINTTPTIGRVLRPYAQYSSPPTVPWDNISNISYHSLQITLKQREWKGLSYTLNYTFSKNIGDDDTSRSAFPVPAAASSSGHALPGKNRADRDLTDTDRPQNLNVYGVDKLPFGKGHIGGNNFLVRNVASGWSLAGMFSYISGTPLSITATSTTCTAPSQGACMPDLVPGMKNKVRINGKWGKGITGANMGAVHYLNSAAFTAPNVYPLPSTANSKAVAVTKIGDAPRHGLAWSPSHYNINLSMSRSFNITPDRLKFIFRADCSDVTNTVVFGGINTTWSAASTSTFGEVTSVSGNRDFQFSGRFVF